MDRRAFIVGTSLGLLAVPLAAEAQQVSRPTIGILDLGSPANMRPYWDAFRTGLRERGYVEGESIAIEYRSANDQADRLPALVAELLAMNVKVIVATGTTSIQAAQAVTKTTPIVSAATADPVTMRFAQSLARPGGNVTGLSTHAGRAGRSEIIEKRVEMLRQAMPQTKVIALLVHGANPGNPVFVDSVKNAASSLSLHSQAFEVGTVGELEDTFTRIARTKADALMVIDDPTFATHAQEIAALALNHRIPTMFGSHHFVRAGGLMAYGVVYEDLFRRAAIFVDRILRGANPADMPIEQPTKFELVINLKTAKALGLTIPPSVLGRADQVIE